MLGRVLVDSDDWKIVSGLLGGIKVTFKQRRLTLKANRFERNHLFDVLDELRQEGVQISPESKEFTEVMTLFAEALFGRGDAKWLAFFQYMTASEIADGFRKESQKKKKKAVLDGINLAQLDNEYKETAFIERYGCSACKALPKNNTAYQDLPYSKMRRLYDSSHDTFWLVECISCKQKYLEYFHDEIDWSEKGDDPMWSRWTPLRSEEIEQLDELEGDLSGLTSLSRKRIFILSKPSGEYVWAGTYNNSSNSTGAQNAPSS